MTRHIASEKARAHWREILDAVAAGEEIVIERYGRPVATLAPYPQDLAPGVREPSPVYDSADLHALKEEIAVDVAAHILQIIGPPLTWPEGLALLQKQVADAGGLGFGDDPDAIVEQMRKTRQEIFEADYAHLYR
mgnify:FL=1|jgi:antitoxin (DNA-binding transcriptional repressor) of toxin-antitoxin stability system